MPTEKLFSSTLKERVVDESLKTLDEVLKKAGQKLFHAVGPRTTSQFKISDKVTFDGKEYPTDIEGDIRVSNALTYTLDKDVYREVHSSSSWGLGSNLGVRKGRKLPYEYHFPASYYVAVNARKLDILGSVSYFVDVSIIVQPTAFRYHLTAKPLVKRLVNDIKDGLDKLDENVISFDLERMKETGGSSWRERERGGSGGSGDWWEDFFRRYTRGGSGEGRSYHSGRAGGPPPGYKINPNKEWQELAAKAGKPLGLSRIQGASLLLRVAYAYQWASPEIKKKIVSRLPDKVLSNMPAVYISESLPVDELKHFLDTGKWRSGFKPQQNESRRRRGNPLHEYEIGPYIPGVAEAKIQVISAIAAVAIMSISGRIFTSVLYNALRKQILSSRSSLPKDVFAKIMSILEMAHEGASSKELVVEIDALLAMKSLPEPVRRQIREIRRNINNRNWLIRFLVGFESFKKLNIANMITNVERAYRREKAKKAKGGKK